MNRLTRVITLAFWTLLSLSACSTFPAEAAPEWTSSDPVDARLRWAEGSVHIERAEGGVRLDNRRAPLSRWPLNAGDLVSTGSSGRADIDIGGARLRLDSDSDLVLQRLDDHVVGLRLQRGSLALHIPRPDAASAFDIDTDAGLHQPLGPGLFRVDAGRSVRDDFSATAWRSPLRITQNSATLTLRPGQRAELFLGGGWRLTAPEADAFARWALSEDRPPEPPAPPPVVLYPVPAYPPPVYGPPPVIWGTRPQPSWTVIIGNERDTRRRDDPRDGHRRPHHDERHDGRRDAHPSPRPDVRGGLGVTLPPAMPVPLPHPIAGPLPSPGVRPAPLPALPVHPPVQAAPQPPAPRASEPRGQAGPPASTPPSGYRRRADDRESAPAVPVPPPTGRADARPIRSLPGDERRRDLWPPGAER